MGWAWCMAGVIVSPGKHPPPRIGNLNLSMCTHEHAHTQAPWPPQWSLRRSSQHALGCWWTASSLRTYLLSAVR